MPLNQQEMELEKTVSAWLKNQQPSLSFVQSRRVTTKGQESLEVDFLVLSPMPMAIEVSIPGNHTAMMHNEKRLLYKRIALAERFGSSLPLIMVVPNHEYSRPIPYADLVLSAEQLPAFDCLKSQIHMSGEVQRILKDGYPEKFQITEKEAFEEIWSNTITLGDMASFHTHFQEGTLASKLKAYLQPTKERIENTPISIREAASLRNPNRPMPRRKWFQRMNRSESLQVDRIIFDFIEEKCGGRIEKKRYRDSFTPLEWNIWHSPSGKQVLIYRRMVSVISLRHKLKEMVADAWLARAFSKKKFSAQVLLVGEYEPLDENLVTMLNEFGPMKIQYLNDLEASGWRVAPFDFDKAEPLLIKILKEAQND